MDSMNNPRKTRDIDVIQDDSFSYDGFQVVRGEFFAHIYEPSFTIYDNKVQVNTACVKKLPEVEFVQIMVNKERKVLCVRPCLEEDRDSIRWCRGTEKRVPKPITCRMFFALVVDLMEWDPTYRYKILGKLIQAGKQLLFVFDLSSPEIFTRKKKDDGKTSMSRKASYPDEWKNQFGVPATEHQNKMQIGIFNEQTVFFLEQNQKQSSAPSATEKEVSENEHPKQHEAEPMHRPEEKTYPNPQNSPSWNGQPGLYSDPYKS